MKLRHLTGARKAGLVLVLAGSALFLGGCPRSAPPPSEQEAPQVVYLNHTVKYPGETLAVISSWYTGSARNWQAIVKHNPGLNPKRIRVGNVILIPRALVVKEDPMPERFVRAAAPKPAPTAAPTEGEQPAEATVIEREAVPNVEEPSEAPSEPTTIVAPTPEAIQALEPAVSPAGVAPAAPAEPAAAAAATEVPPAAAAAGSAASAAAEGGARKIKTRDELLRELLEE